MQVLSEAVLVIYASLGCTISTTYLENLIARLVQVEKLEILPAGEVLKRTAS